MCYTFSYGSPSYYSPPSSSNDYSEEEDIYDDDYDESTEGPSVIDPWSGLTEVNNSILFLGCWGLLWAL